MKKLVRKANGRVLGSTPSVPLELSKGMRETLQQHHSELYSYSPLSSNRARIPRPSVETVSLSGVKATIVGSYWNNFNASEMVLHELDVKKPDVVVVAGMHPWSHERYIDPIGSWIKPVVKYPTDEDLFVRAKFAQFFGKVFQRQMFYFFDACGVFYQANMHTRVCLPDVHYTQSDLSACYWGYEDERAKVVAAGAPPLVIQEHLATQFTVQQLRDMYQKTITEVIQRSKAIGAQVPEYENEMYERVTGIAKELFGDELLTHRILYTAGVLHKTCQAYRHPLLVQDEQILQTTVYTCRMPTLPHYSELYKPLAYKEPLETLLEKMAILTYLDANSFMKHCSVGGNPLTDMYQGQFAHVEFSKVKEVFDHYHSVYRAPFEDAFVAELERLPNSYTEGRTLPKLGKSLARIESRESSLPTQIIHEQVENELKSEVLLSQIQRNIQARISAGISQTQEVLALQQISQGEVNPSNREIVSRLVFEANEQLRLTTLPPEFEKYKKYMRWGVTEGELGNMLNKDFLLTASLNPKMTLDNLSGFFYDPENPPKAISEQEKNHFTMVLGKGEAPFDVEDKSLEELKAMGAEEIGVIDGEVTRSGLRIDQVREKKRQLGEAFAKAGLMNAEQ